MERDDAELLQRWRGGDRTAFEALFARHYRRVYGALYGLVGPSDAEDLAQETFLTLYRTPPALGGEVIGAWLARVAINRGINWLRGARRAAARIERSYEPDFGVDPADVAVSEETRAAVRAALRRLPERQASLLALRHAGYSYAEIAAALEVAPSSVGSLLSRAERAFLAVCEPSLAVDSYDSV